MIRAIGPKPSFPISPAVVGGNLFVTTCVPVDLKTGQFVEGGIEVQARQVLTNLDALLKEAGGGLADVAHMTVYLVDAKDAAGMNKVYAEFFTREPFPSRATIVARELIGPAGMRVEATAQAILKG